MLLGGVVTALVIHSSAIALRAGVQVALARWLGAEALGRYLLVVTVASLLAAVAGLGLPQAALRFVSAHAARGDAASLQAFLGFARRSTAVVGIAVGATAAGVAWTSGAALDGLAPMALGVAVLLGALLLLHGEVARSLGGLVVAYAPQQALPAALTLAGAAALRVAGRLDLTTALLAYAAALLVSAVIQAMALERLLPRTSRAARNPEESPATWLRVSVPLLGSFLLALAMVQGDIVIVGVLLGALDTGIYGAAARIGLVAGLPLLAVSAVAVPALARTHAQGGGPAFRSRMRLTAQIAFAGALGCAAAIVIFGGPLLGVFGTEFRAGDGVLRIIVTGQLVQAAVGPAEQILGVTGHHDVALGALAAMGALYVGATATFAVAWGIEGAAIGAAGAQAVRAAWMAALVSRRLGARSFVW
jgi:O-antigen/teichoic acid export membrane protein